jgi:type II secretory pathway pseudopilin PulG
MRQGEEGITLLEVAAAISLVTVLILAVGVTLMSGTRYRQETFRSYLASNALQDLLSEIQETANMPQNLANQEGIGAIYSKYHNQTIAIPELTSGQIAITCYPDEAAVPAILGGPQDLNFDGDALDNLGNYSAGSDLKLVPMRLIASFVDGGTTRTVTIHRLVTRTAN